MIENGSMQSYPIPDDFQSALALSAPASEAFARLDEAGKRRFVASLDGAGPVDERMARIDEAVQALAEGQLS